MRPVDASEGAGLELLGEEGGRGARAGGAGVSSVSVLSSCVSAPRDAVREMLFEATLLLLVVGDKGAISPIAKCSKSVN